MADKYDKNLIEYMMPFLSEELDEETEISDELKDKFETGARRIRMFIDEIPGGFFIYRNNQAEEIVYANKALLKIFGCKTMSEFRELTHNSFRGIVHPDDLERIEKDIADQIAESTEQVDYVEYRIIRKDGMIRWVEDYGHYIHREGGGDYYYVFITDATEKIARRLVETATLMHERKESEQRLKNLIEEYDKERMLIRQEHLQRLEVIEGLSYNYDSILYADLDKNIVLPYRLSVRLERQFDKKLQERELDWFLDDYVKVWVHPDDKKKVAAYTDPDYIRKTLKKDKTYYFNYRCIKDGEIQYIQLRISNVGEENISQIVMGYRNVDKEIIQEMDEKRLFQTALAKARLGTIARNTFLSNMSHDMRTPLNAVFGFVELAKKCGVSPEVEGYLAQIKTAGEQILEQVNKVLEISDAESRDFSLNERPCSLSKIINKVYDKLNKAAEEKHIAMTLDLKGIEHDAVYADADKVERIFAHVADNAVKYTPKGGKVDIDVIEQKSMSPKFRSFTITVADNGVGISKEGLKKIFEPFERLTDTTASGEYGAGLGLTIAKQLVETMGGNIKAESKVSVGSTFKITFSLRYRSKTKRKEKSAGDSMREIFDPKGKRILIVEDNEINLEIETELLTDLGFITETAENGKIAVDMVTAAEVGYYDLVLMDIQMPVMDGRAAAEAIRKLSDKSKANIPIIALSANAFESDKRESIKSGMNAHMTKPIEVDELMKTIAVALFNK